MPSQSDQIQELTALNRIAETLNRAVDVRGALQATLPQLLELLGLETGWVFLRDPASQDRWCGRGYVCAAHHNLPPALDPASPEAWDRNCDCQSLCDGGKLTEAYNEVRCSRLAAVYGERRGLAVHASAPLRSGNRVLGILNVAAAEWEAFTPRALALLGTVANEIGAAVERGRLYDLLRVKRAREQAGLYELSQQLLEKLNLDDVMRHLAVTVRQLMQADACAILLPDVEGQHLVYRAADGWREDPAARGRQIMAEEDSGPARVYRSQQPLLVEDIQGIPRMTEWLRAEGFRGRALVPLIAGGNSIGVLALNQRVPRRLDEEELRFLRLMANQAALAIEKARLHEEEVAHQRLEQELSVAREIQLSLLPRALPNLPGWDFAAYYQPARLVGGDFYDFFAYPHHPGRLGMVIADVADKGMPAALFMAMSRSLIRSAAIGGAAPAAALRRTNVLIRHDSRSEIFVTVVYGVLEPLTGHLTYANGGHPRPLLWRAASGTVEDLPARGMLLGTFDDIVIQEADLELAPGDILLLYTDGLSEMWNARRRQFGDGRLREALANAACQPRAGAQQVLEAILESAHGFAGLTPQADDVTAVVVKRT